MTPGEAAFVLVTYDPRTGGIFLGGVYSTRELAEEAAERANGLRQASLTQPVTYYQERSVVE